MDVQIAEMRKELQIRSAREQDANDTIKMQAQALMKEKQQLEVCMCMCMNVYVHECVCI
jgi:hypothetical protein